jgi:hypothetical protein
MMFANDSILLLARYPRDEPSHLSARAVKYPLACKTMRGRYHRRRLLRRSEAYPDIKYMVRGS